MYYKGIILMLLSGACVSSGQFFWKISTAILDIFFCLGWGLYGLGAILMVGAMRFAPLSRLHPLMAFSYVLAAVLGHYYLGELLTVSKCVGIAIISLGIVLIGGGK